MNALGACERAAFADGRGSQRAAPDRCLHSRLHSAAQRRDLAELVRNKRSSILSALLVVAPVIVVLVVFHGSRSLPALQMPALRENTDSQYSAYNASALQPMNALHIADSINTVNAHEKRVN